MFQTKKKQKQSTYMKPMAQKQVVQHKREKRVEKNGSQKTVQQLLGELYADKVYLEKLLDDNSNKEKIFSFILTLISIIFFLLSRN